MKATTRYAEPGLIEWVGRRRAEWSRLLLWCRRDRCDAEQLASATRWLGNVWASRRHNVCGGGDVRQHPSLFFDFTITALGVARKELIEVTPEGWGSKDDPLIRKLIGLERRGERNESLERIQSKLCLYKNYQN